MLALILVLLSVIKFCSLFSHLGVSKHSSWAIKIYQPREFGRFLCLFIILSYPSANFGESARKHPTFPTDAPSFQHILPDELASIGAVNSIAQDHKGFMWFGGQNGLARYDGYEIKVYRNKVGDKNSLSHNYVWDILVDKRGYIWIATRLGLSIFSYESDSFSRVKKLSRPETHENILTNNAKTYSGYFTEVIYCIIEDNNGDIWFARDDKGLVRYRYQEGNGTNASIETMDYFFENPSQHRVLKDATINALLVDHNGSLWLGTAKKGVFIYNLQNDHLERYTFANTPDGLSHNQVRSLARDNKNNIWIGTFGGGVNRYDSEKRTFTHYRYNHTNNNAISNEYIWDIMQDSQDRLWFATDQGGLNRYITSVDGFSHYPHSTEFANSPATNSVTSLFEDRVGDIWVGYSPSGVDVIHKHSTNFVNYKHNPFKPSVFKS